MFDPTNTTVAYRTNKDPGYPEIPPTLEELSVLIADNTALIADNTEQLGQLTMRLAISLVNKTGAASVKGSVVSASTAHDNSFMLQTNEFDSIGVVLESGIADGQPCLLITNGIAEVLLKDNTASTRGYWVIAADTDGRANATQPTPASANTTAEHTVHFKELGHCLESKVAGTNVLAKCMVHFN